jgi:pimeloyl-ACP methyl ester carboxylesterase
MNALIVTAIVLAVLILAYAGTAFIFAQLTLNPKRQPIALSPADYGMAYEDIEFRNLEGQRLRGWFIPGDPRKVLLMTHPMFCNRHGFLAKNKSIFMPKTVDIDLLLSMKALNQAGYSILSFDFRNHGASDKGLTGVGITEYQDVLGAIEYLKRRGELAQAELGLVGFCMGANAIMVALSQDPKQFAKARCMVAVQPISMNVFIRSYLRSSFGPLGLIMYPMINLLRQRLGGHSLEAMSPKPYVKDISIPILYAQGKVDPWTELADIQSIYDSTEAPKDFWWLETKNRPEAYQYVSENPRRMIEFLDAHMREKKPVMESTAA